MVSDLTPFSMKCLKLLLNRYPQFEPYVVPSHYYDHHWYSEIPWPVEIDDWDPSGLACQTHESPYGEEFRVDIGYWHDHYGNFSNSDSDEWIKRPFQLIEDFLNEKFVVVAVWYRNPTDCSTTVEDLDYNPPLEMDWPLHDYRIWKRSWKDSYNQQWNLKPDDSKLK